MSTYPQDIDKLSLLPTGTVKYVKEGASTPAKWVFQRVHPEFGNRGTRGAYGLQLRAHVIPNNPRTAPQQLNRGKFAAATAAWHDLSDAEKSTWKRQAKGIRATPYNAFVQYFMLHAVYVPTDWDDDGTDWDDGETVWD